jgi:hypothetical protein
MMIQLSYCLSLYKSEKVHAIAIHRRNPQFRISVSCLWKCEHKNLPGLNLGTGNKL